MLSLASVSAQTLILNNPGTSYTGSDAVTTNSYPVSVSGCTSLSFSIQYNFSLPWEGPGNMETSDECPSGAGCAGDPTSGANTGPCANCWDFIYVRFQIGGVTVFSELVGEPGTTDAEQSGTFTFGPVCTNGATTANIIVQTQTWASDETITFSNVTIECWDSRATLSANPTPYCESQVLNLNATLSNPSSVSNTQWSGPGTIADPGALNTTVTGLPVGTNTFTFTATDDNGCTRSSTLNVNVGASPTLNPPADVTVCGGSPTFNIPLSGTAGATYGWTNDNTLIGLGASGTATNNISITPANVSTQQVATITITPRIGACFGPPQTVMVTINPRPTVTNPGPRQFCGGADIDIPLSGSSSTATYNWTNSNIAIGVPANGSDVVSGTAANVPNTLTGNITITPTENGCNGPVQSFQITVSPSPSVNPIPSITRCGGQLVTLNFSGSGGGTLFDWTNNNPAVGLLQTSGTGNTVTFTTAAVTSQEVATITVTPRLGPCTGIQETFTITVIPPPAVADPPNQTLCSGQQMVVNFTGGTPGAVYSWSNSNTNIGLPASGSGNINTPAPTVTATTTSTLTVRATDGGCQGNTQTFTITINPAPTVNALPDLTYCAGQPAGVSIGGSPGATFNWTNNNTNIGLGASGNTSIAFTTANVSAPTVATVTVTPVVGTCNGPQRSFTITVNPIPALTDPPDLNLCVGDPINVNFSAIPSNAVLSWSNSNTNTGLGASGTGNISNGTAANVTTVQTGVVTVTPTIGSCAGPVQSFNLTVSPTPTVNAIGNVAACAGLPVNINLSGTTNATFNWLNNNTAIGLPATGSGTTISFTASAAAVSQTATVNVIASLNGCSGPVQPFNITVTPTPVLAAPPNQNLCGGAPLVTSFNSTPVGANFNWTNSNTAIGLSATGSGDFNTSAATVSTVQTGTIAVTPVIGTCSGAPQTFTVTVTPVPNLNALPPVSRCAGDVIALPLVATPAATINWTNDNTATGLGASGSGDLNFTAAAVSSPQISNITVTPVIGACSGIPRTFALTVNPIPTLNNPGTIRVCGGAPIQVNFTGTATAFSWSNSNTNIGVAGSGTTNISATAANVGATGTITATPTGICAGPAQTFDIIVTEIPTLNTLPDLSLCSGQATSVAIGGTAGATYNWTNSNTNIGLGSSGTGNISSFTVTTPNGTPETANISVTSVNGSCPGPSATFSIAVNPSTSVDDPADVAVCAGDPVSVNFTGNASSYNWTNNNTSIGLGASGSGNISFNAGANAGTALITVVPGNGGTCAGPGQTFSITIASVVSVAPVPATTVCANQPVKINFSGTPGTQYTWTNSNTAVGLPAGGNGNLDFTSASVGAAQTATITVTPRAGSCAGTPETFNLTVNPVPGVSPVTPVNVCAGSALNVTFSGTGNPTFNWTSSNPQLGLPASGSGNITGTAPNTVAPLSSTIVVTPSAGGCTGPAETFLIQVNPVPVVAPVANVATCAGQSVSINFSGSGTTPVYTWTNSNTNIGLPAGGTGNISFTAPATPSAISAMLSVTAMDANGCTGPAQNFDLSISPLPGVNAMTDVTACAGTNVSVAFIGTIGAGFTWTNNNPSIGLPAAGSTNRLNFTGTNTGVMPDTATIVVTPTLGNCIGATEQFRIIVHPNPSVDSVPDLTVCSQSPVNVNFNGSPGATFSWINDNTATGLDPAGNGSINITAANVNTDQKSVVTVTPAGSVCQGQVRRFNLTVLALPVVTKPADQALCGGDSLHLLLTGTAGATFNWINSNSNIGLPQSGAGNLHAPVSSVNTAQTALFTVTPILNNCPGTPVDFSLTVNPRPVPIITGNLSICAGQSTQLSAGGGDTYRWNTGENTATITVMPFANNAYNVTVTSNAGCSATQSATVTVREPSGTTRLATTCDPAQAGVKTAMFVNQQGCDSIVTTITTLLRRDTTQLSRVTCNPALAGVFTKTLPNNVGCDSLIVETVTFDPAGRDTTRLMRSSCDPAQAGVREVLMTGADGCDSLIITTTLLLASDTTRLTRKSCNLAQVGTVTQRLANQVGCDSLIITTTLFDPAGIDTTVLRFVSCNPAQVGNTQTLLKGKDGCDSLVVRITTFDPIGRDTTVLRRVTCNPAQAGTVQNLLQGQDGCDSLIIRITTFDPAGRDTTRLSRQSCDPGQLGSIQTLLVGQDGCDSLIITTTTLAKKDTTLRNEGTCDPALVGTNTSRLLQNRLGCDSLVLTTYILDQTLCIFQSSLASIAPKCANSNDAVVNLRVNSGIPPYQYQWSSGSGGTGSGQITALNTPVAIPNLPPGQFSVTITKGGGAVDTVLRINIAAPPALNLTATATLPAPPYAFRCATDTNGQATAAAVGGGGTYTYQWSNGSTLPTAERLAPGTYTVTASDQNRCTATTTVKLTAPPALSFNVAVSKPDCGETLATVLFSGSGGVKPYTAGINGNTLNNLSATLSNGRYLVSLTDQNGCTLDSTLNIALLPSFTVVLPPDTTLRIGQELTLQASTDLAGHLIDTVIWRPLPEGGQAGQLTQQWAPQRTQRYTVTVVDTFGCTESAEITVRVRRDVLIYVPNVFTPGSKVGNDFFTVSAGPGVETLDELRIYDRWGNLTYRLEAPITVNEWPGWDGRMAGKEVGQGVYVYYLKVRLSDGSLFEKSGDVTVLRR